MIICTIGYLYMMGQGSQSLNMVRESDTPDLAQLILCLFIFVTTILILNLLIALMNNSYSKIQDKARAEWNRERADIMVEQPRASDIKRPKHSYYLVRLDDRDNFERVQREGLEARLARIEHSVKTELMDKQAELIDAVKSLKESQDAQAAVLVKLLARF